VIPPDFRKRPFSKDLSTATDGKATVMPDEECHLVIGQGPGTSTYFDTSHPFTTQVGPTIEEACPVVLDVIPEFVLPIQLRGGFLGWGGTKGGDSTFPGGATGEVPAEAPSWMFDLSFAVQVLMWNPEVFPQLPEQHSPGLHVMLLPNGGVTSTQYGTDVGGLDVWHELDVNEQGQRVIRFPFSIPGF